MRNGKKAKTQGISVADWADTKNKTKKIIKN